MKKLFKKLKSASKARISELIDAFGEKLEKAYDDYQAELDDIAEKVSDMTGYDYAKATLEADGVINVDAIDETAVSDVVQELVDSDNEHPVRIKGIVIVDHRESQQYKKDCEFFALLTEAETRSDLTYLEWVYPTRMQDPDVREYVEIVSKVVR